MLRLRPRPLETPAGFLQGLRPCLAAPAAGLSTAASREDPLGQDAARRDARGWAGRSRARARGRRGTCRRTADRRVDRTAIARPRRDTRARRRAGPGTTAARLGARGDPARQPDGVVRPGADAARARRRRARRARVAPHPAAIPAQRQRRLDSARQGAAEPHALRVTVRTRSGTVSVYRDGNRVQRFRAVVGAPATPTPHVLAALLRAQPPAGPAGVPRAMVASANRVLRRAAGFRRRAGPGGDPRPRRRQPRRSAGTARGRTDASGSRTARSATSRARSGTARRSGCGPEPRAQPERQAAAGLGAAARLGSSACPGEAHRFDSGRRRSLDGPRGARPTKVVDPTRHAVARAR